MKLTVDTSKRQGNWEQKRFTTIIGPDNKVYVESLYFP